jgi:hypothetical protein
MAEQHRRGDSARAYSHQVEIGTAGDRRDYRGRLLARVDVIVEAHVAVLGARISPAHREELMPVRDRILGEAALRREVHHVVLVDFGRDQHHRPFIHLRGRRLVLDQLDQLAAMHYCARRHREIAADLEWPLVHLRRHRAVVEQVIHVVAKTVEEAAAGSIERALERPRIAEQRIGRRQRFGQQRHRETFLRGELPVLTRNGFGLESDKVVQRRSPGEVNLHQAAIEGILAERRIVEAPIAGLRLEIGNAGSNLRQVEQKARHPRTKFIRMRREVAQELPERGEKIARADTDERIRTENRVNRRRVLLGIGKVEFTKCRSTHLDASKTDKTLCVADCKRIMASGFGSDVSIGH